MQTALIKHLGKYAGEEVEIRGWLFNKRSSGKIRFLIIRDGSGQVQGVLAKAETDPELFELAGSIPRESSIRVTGVVREEPRAPAGYELTVTGLQVVQEAEEYPVTLKKHGVEFLADRRHLWIRGPRQAAVLRVRSEMEQAVRDFFYRRDYVLADSPIITALAAEGTTNLFEIDYHGEKAYLAQTGQLYSEATAMALGRVYNFGPVFRAEKSKTRRHLLEFWMAEAETAYCDFEANLRLQEELIYYLVQRILERCRQELKTLQRDTSALEAVKTPFPRLSYTEAVETLREAGEDFQWGDDFGAPQETLLSEKYHSPVFVHRFPAEIKAFYMKTDPEDERVVLGADLLAPEGYGEIIGGGERIADRETLEKRLQEHNLPVEEFQWYLDLRRYGSVPHSGFGLGIERTLAWICGLEHVRETIPFPRLLYRIRP